MGLLDSLPTFRGWAPEDLAKLEIMGTVLNAAPGQEIFKEGNPGDSLFVVLSGQIQIQKHVKDQDTVLAILKPGEVFGEMALFDGLPRSATARTRSQAQVMKFTVANLQALQDQSLEVIIRFKEVLLKALSFRLREASRDMEVLQFWIT